MIKKLEKPVEDETQDEKVVPFSEAGNYNKYAADEEIDDITF